MREFLQSIRKLIILLCEVAYILKDFIVLLVMGIVGYSLGSTREDRVMDILLCLILFWVCMVLRQLHREYLKLMKKEIADKRFTHIDDFGNPYIKGEDLPEIVEYLYRLEEAENVKSGKKN